MGGKGKGKKAKASFVDQLVALQGTWQERALPSRQAKEWFVQDSKASTFITTKGVKKYSLSEGDQGELVWGEWSYVLDYAFRSGSTEALWRTGSIDGPIAFTWDKVESDTGGKGKDKGGKGKTKGKAKDDDNSGGGKGKGKGKGKADAYEEARGEGKGKSKGKGKAADADAGGKGKGKSNGKAKSEPLTSGGKNGTKSGGKGASWQPTVPGIEEPKEKRMDPADGQTYTWEQLRGFYAGEYTKSQTEAYWAECHRVGKANVQTQEQRIDADDGVAYTWEEIKDHYATMYKPIQILAYWMKMKVKENGKKKGDSSWK